MRSSTIQQQYADTHKGAELPTYTHNGAVGCIYRNEFVSIEELSSMDDVCCDDITVTMDDSYGAYSGCSEIVETDVRCYEDEQRLECCWVTEDWAESDQWERELAIVTDDYYGWTSERTRFINALHQDIDLYGEIDESREQEWEQICSRFSNPLGWETDISYEGIIKQL